MPTKIPTTQLAQRIDKLLGERRQHADAVSRIDAILASVGAALTATIAAPSGKAPTARLPTGKKRRRRRTKYAMSGEASILAFVKENKNPTTQEIKKHWQSESRGGTADNSLSMMVKQKKLKRTPLGKGRLGSRYTLI